MNIQFLFGHVTWMDRIKPAQVFVAVQIRNQCLKVFYIYFIGHFPADVKLLKFIISWNKINQINYSRPHVFIAATNYVYQNGKALQKVVSIMNTVIKVAQCNVDCKLRTE